MEHFQKMIKILIVAGTRPEIIKIAPIILKVKSDFANSIEVKFCFTGQHKSMAEEAIKLFGIKSDYDLEIMQQNQTLNSISKFIFEKLPTIINEFQPDVLFVQGDTTTAATAALCAFNLKIPVGHIEAGLRSFNLDAPFPEEANRKIINTFSKFNFAPTQSAKNNLIKENILPKDIYLVGNTIVDALKIISKKYSLSNLSDFEIKNPYILITAHRRESFGKGFENICNAIKKSAINNPDYDFVYPVHLNPNVQKPVMDILGSLQNVKLLKPQNYLNLLTLLKNCQFVVTDSGGIQEEAPSFNKFCIVMRDVTERIESIENGFAELVGSDENKIYFAIEELIKSNKTLEIKSNPYGDGNSSEKILTIMENYFEK